MDPTLLLNIQKNVITALSEDLLTGDLHTQLFKSDQKVTATLLTREDSLCCGQPWVNQVFHLLDSNIECKWLVSEGSLVSQNTPLAEISGPVAGLLSGERTALNFLQTLMFTAYQCHQYTQLIQHTHAKLLDTRKTLPGLRVAQKYAIKIGGGHNHRMGLWDAFMLKENHIMAAGGIKQAVAKAREINPNVFLEIEVENFQELKSALQENPDRIMLDNFSTQAILDAIKIRDQYDSSCPFEASGNITRNNICQIAETGVEFISMGALTKDCKATDLSLRINYDE